MVSIWGLERSAHVVYGGLKHASLFLVQCHGWQKHVREPGTWEEEAGLGAQGFAVTLKVVWATWDPVLK